MSIDKEGRPLPDNGTMNDSGEHRWDVIQHFIDWFTSDDEESKDLHQSLQLYIQQEIWKENE